MAQSETPALGATEDTRDECGQVGPIPSPFGGGKVICKRKPGHEGAHEDERGVWWHAGGGGARRATCDTIAPFPNSLTDAGELVCKRERGHEGAHESAEGISWSAAPPLGPRPDGVLTCDFRTLQSEPGGARLVRCGQAIPVEMAGSRFCALHDGEWQALRSQFRRRSGLRSGTDPSPPAPSDGATAGVSLDGDSVEQLAAELVLCGKRLGKAQALHEERQRAQKTLVVANALFTTLPGAETKEADWARVGRVLHAEIRKVADELLEPTGPIEARANAVFAVLLRQRAPKKPPANLLIHAGLALEVVRSAWRKAKKGGRSD